MGEHLAARVAEAIRAYACDDELCTWTVDEANEVTTVAGDIGSLAAGALRPELEELQRLRERSARLACDLGDLMEAARAVLDLAECFDPSYEEVQDLADACARADRPLGW